MSQSSHDTALQIGEERIPPGEDQAILGIIQLQTGIMRAQGPDRRGQHPKAHGCVKATFTVSRDIPTELQVGLFREPNQFDALVRFSNGKFDDDLRPDVHGMAIKLVAVTGARAIPGDQHFDQDFILIDSEAFFASDPESLLGFMAASVEAEKSHSATPIQEFEKRDEHSARTVDNARNLLKGNVPSPLVIPYWSTVPYRCGTQVVKYSVKPAEGNRSGTPQLSSQNYLSEAMVEHLSRRKLPAAFDFYVQQQTNADTMPIEDPTVPWSSPEIKVATLEIGPQDFDTPERNRLCEESSCSPWHALDVHKPLGGINRARKPVYEASSSLRHAPAP